MDNEKTGRLIAEARREKGLTQKALARTLHISDRTVSKWERGAGFPDVSLLADLAGALDLSVGELLAGRRQPREEPEPDGLLREVVGLQKRQLGKKLALSRILAAALAALFLALLVLVAVRWPRPAAGRAWEDYTVSPGSIPVTEEVFCALLAGWLDGAVPEDGLVSLSPCGRFWVNVCFYTDGSGMLRYELFDREQELYYAAEAQGTEEDFRPSPDRLLNFTCRDLSAYEADHSYTDYTRFRDWAAAMFRYLFGGDTDSVPRWSPG